MINSTPTEALRRELETLDDGVAAFGTLVAHPKEWLISLDLRVIRLRETSDIPHVMDVLSQV
jgi:hypothetical protein